MKKEFKLPTIVGLLLLVVGVAAGVVLVGQAQIFKLRAKPSEIPQQVRITNIKDDSFSVSWTTEEATLGFVSYGKNDSLGGTAQDDAKASTPRTLHHVTVTGLSPNTTYLFKIGSGGNFFDNDGKPYSLTTASKISAPSRTDVIFGTVQTPGGAPVPGGIVYVTISGVTPLSVLTDPEGKWTITLSTARSSSLGSLAHYKETDKAQIFVQAQGQFASATIPIGAAKPVPPITLGQTHDFTNLEVKKSDELPSSQITLPEEQPQSPSSGFNLEGGPRAGSPLKISLSNPEAGEGVNSAKPQFSGTGTPGEKFTIQVESEVITDQVTVGPSGSWNWTPPDNLEPGEHTVTLSWKDEAGQTRVLKRTFTVLAAATSELPSFTASPSATLATPSPSPKPTPVPSPSPSPRSSLPSTEGGVPTPGNLTTTLAFLIMGVSLVFTGLFLPRIHKS